VQGLTDKVIQSSKRLGLRINKQKTKIMTISEKKHEIRLSGEHLGHVKEFVYLESTITEDRKCGDDKKRSGLASTLIGKLSKIQES